MHTEDGYLIQKCLSGESEAFGFLVDKYKASVYYFLLSRLRNVHDAEDVSQRVFLRAYERLRSLRRWESFAKWLYSIAYTQSRNFIREKQNRPDREFLEEQDPCVMINHSMDSYHEEQATESLKETVEEALNSLPEMYREVLVLHYIGGMQNKEIAVILGTSIDNIKQRLSRARSMLKEEVLAMMSVAYDQQQKLTAKFTFHIMEMIKKLKIHPVSTAKGLPWGLSLAAGVMLAIMSINPTLISFIHIGTPVYAPLPSETKVLKIGEIPVDVVKTSNTPFLSGNIGRGNGGEPKQPDMQNSFFLAPKGEGGIWAKKTDMPTPRLFFSTSVVDGVIYAIGGGKGFNDALSAVEAYNPVTDTWTKKADMPTPRQVLSTVAVKRKIYAIGGWDGGHEISTVEAYDPATDAWTKKANMPTQRDLAGIAVVDGIIYAIGGCNGKRLSTVEAYNPETDTWTRKADMPTARWGVVAASTVDGVIYAIGGETAPSTPSYAVEVYDPAADIWTKMPNMPAWTATLTFVNYWDPALVNGRIYMTYFSETNLSAGGMISYDLATDTWTKEPDPPTIRRDLSIAVVNGRIYGIGGTRPGTWNGLATVEEFTPEDWSSAISPKGKLPKSWGNLKSR